MAPPAQCQEPEPKDPPAAKPGADSQATSFGRLAEEAVGKALKLSEEQKASVAEIVRTRDEALAAAEDSAKPAIRADAETKLKAVLDDEQQRLFAELFSETLLKFNFRLQKWPAVLDWFADEAGLSLVMDEPPPGVFNYSDAKKEYTTTEAIDLLNGWLLTKGFTLIRRERLLMVVGLKEGLPDGAIPRVSLEELATRGRFEFVSVLFPLEGRPSEAVIAEVTPLLGTYGKVQSLPSTKQLLLSGAGGSLREIIQLAKQVPVPGEPPPKKKPEPPPKPELIVYPIEHANPKQAGEVLKQIVDGTILVDETAKQITINAIPAEHAKAKIVITQLESNQGPDRQRELQLYGMRPTNSSESLATLTLIVPDAQYRYDEASKKLVVWATPTDQLRVSTALKKLEADQPGRGVTNLEVYRLTRVDPSSAQSLISNLLPDVKVTVDERTRSLIAIGTLLEHQAINTLLEQLQPKTPDEDTPELRTYPSADLATDTVTSLLASLTPRAQITEDAANRRLLIMASAEQHEQIAKMLEQLADKPDAPQREITTYPVAPADAGSVISLLESLTPNARVTHDEPNERLVVVAPQADHAQVASVLERISAKDDGAQTIQAYPARDIDVDSVTSLLSTLAPKASVTIDATHQRLLVVASVEDHATVDNVLQQVAVQEPAGEPELKSYPVQPKVTLSTLAELLSSLIPNAKVTSDEPNRRLLVVAAPKEHTLVQQTIQQVEKDAGGEVPELKFYPLKKSDGSNAVTIVEAVAPGARITFESNANRLSVVANAADHSAVAATLTKLEESAPASEKRTLKIHEVTATQRTRFQELLSGLESELPGLQLITDAEPDELAIWATPSQQEAVEQILSQLKRDVPPEQKRKLIVYPIRKTDPASVSDVLSTLFPNTQVTVDEKASRLLIHARPAEHDTIRSAIEQLDSDTPVEKEIKLMAYPVKGLNSDVALNLLREELPDLSVIQDTTAQTMIVRATLAEHQQVAELLDALRTASSTTTKRSLVVYPLTFSNGSLAKSFLQSAFPDASMFPDDSTGRMTVWATAAEHERLRAAIAEMTGNNDDATGPRLERYKLEGVEPSSLTPLLSQVVPQARLVFSPDNTALLAWGRPAEHTAIQRVVSQMAGDAAPARRSLRAFDVTKPGGDLSRQVLSSVVPEVKFLETGKADSLLAWVDDDQQKLIESTLKQLSETDSAVPGRSLKFYSIADAGPQASSVLGRTVPGATINEGSQPGQLMIEATAAEHTKITAMIKQLEANLQDTDRSLKFYEIAKLGSESEVRGVLSATVPDVTFTTSSDNSRLHAWVLAGEDQKIQSMLEQLAETQPFQTKRTLEAYSIFGLGSDIRSVLSEAVPGAAINSGPKPDQILIVARVEEHADIKKVLDRLKAMKAPVRPKALQVYELDGVDPAAVREVLQPLVDGDVQLTVDPTGKRLFVRAHADKQAAIGQVVKQVSENIVTRKGVTTKAYWVGNSNADEAQEAMRGLFPEAVLAIDADQKLLIATALPTEHETIARVVDQMSGGPGAEGKPVAKKYALPRVNPQQLLRMFDDLFDGDDVRFVTDTQTRTLVAVAPPKHHETIRELIDQFDTGDVPVEQRSVEFYSLSGADGGAAQTLIENVLETLDPQAKVIHETGTRQLVVTTNEGGHTRVKTLLEKLRRPDEREVEVLQLSVLEPTSAEYAILAMFDDDGPDGVPTVQSDEDTQQLLIRATKPQIEQIRTLLVKMGETDLKSGTGTSTRNLRIIPLGGHSRLDVDSAIKRIEQLWPRLRKNPLRIIRPVEPAKEPLKESPRGQFSVPESDPPALPQEKSNRVAEVEQSEPLVQQPVEQPVKPATKPEQPPAEPTDPSPVVIVPGAGRLTIASDDTEALNQMESLLRAIFSRGGRARGRDFTIYALRNAGAKDVAETLNRIFERNRVITSGSVVIVPEQRLNALVVFAGRTDRDRIESLIEALDSDRDTDTLTAYKTKVIAVKHADAARITTVVTGIFQAETTAGGARQSISIPEGVSSEVASVLRQINAAASSPLLTIQTQVSTNSLVVKAPQNLLDEVETLIHELDEATVTRGRGLTIIPLRRTNSLRMMEALRQIMEQ